MRKYMSFCGVQVRIHIALSSGFRYWFSRIAASVITVVLFALTVYLMYLTDIP